MAKKDQFDFVNDTKSDIDIVDDLQVEKGKEEDNQIDSKNFGKESKQKLFKKYLFTATAMMIISALIVYLLLLWQDEYTLLAWGDALWVAFILEFFVAWIFLIYNLNILSPLMYGYKSFFLMFVGKRPKMGYYEYTQNIENSPIPKYYIIVVFLSAFILFIPALITLLILI